MHSHDKYEFGWTGSWGREGKRNRGERCFTIYKALQTQGL